MLLPTTTWGQLREIALKDVKSGSQSSDNLLARDPGLMKIGEDKGNDEYVWPKEAEEFLEAIGEDPAAVTAAAGAPERESPLYFTADDDGNVLELVKDEDDSISIRVDGEWVDISDEEDFPTYYEQQLVPATDDSVGAWDAELEDNPKLTLDDISEFIGG